MTRLDVMWNSLGEEGEAARRKALEGRSGFVDPSFFSEGNDGFGAARGS